MQYLLLFLSSFLAATIIPFSSEAHLYFLVANNYNLYLLLVAASLGNTLGGMSSYYLGYLCKWSWLEKYFKIKESKVRSNQLKVQKYGAWIALLCWLPVVGDGIAVALGLFRLNWKRVMFLMFVGKTLRYVFLLFFIELITGFFY